MAINTLFWSLSLGLVLGWTACSTPAPALPIPCQANPDNRNAYLTDMIRRLVESPDNAATKQQVLGCITSFLSPDSRLLIEHADGSLDYSSLGLYVANEAHKQLTLESVEFTTGKDKTPAARIRTRFVALITAPTEPTARPDTALTSPPAAAHTFTLAPLYQGTWQGHVRRLRLEQFQTRTPDNITFRYTLVGSTNYDKNKEGAFNPTTRQLHLETLGDALLVPLPQGQHRIECSNGAVFEPL